MSDIQDAFKKLVEAEILVAAARDVLTPHLKRTDIVVMCGIVRDIRHYRDIATNVRLKEIHGDHDAHPDRVSA